MDQMRRCIGDPHLRLPRNFTKIAPMMARAGGRAGARGLGAGAGRLERLLCGSRRRRVARRPDARSGAGTTDGGAGGAYRVAGAVKEREAHARWDDELDHRL